MVYETTIKNRIKNNIEYSFENENIDQDKLDDLIDKCVSVNETHPIYEITANQFEAYSKKPTNVKVEFDISSAFGILSQVGLLSSDPIATFGSICALCALVSKKAKIRLEPETAFVYWVAYENQHDPWEIPKDELIELASSKSSSMDISINLTEDEVKDHIDQLCHYNSFRTEHKSGGEYLILRERCSSDW